MQAEKGTSLSTGEDEEKRKKREKKKKKKKKKKKSEPDFKSGPAREGKRRSSLRKQREEGT